MMVTVYGKTGCSYCKKALDELLRRKIDHEYYDCGNPDMLKKLKRLLPEVKTVPQIWVNGRYVGGYNEMMGIL